MSETDAASTQDRRILVGVFIIVLLVGGVGLFLIVGNRSVTICKRTEPLVTLTALESAVNNIYVEYEKLPDVGNQLTTDSPQGLKLLNILLGLDTKSENSLNPRGIKFLNVKEGKDNKGGLIYSADGNSVEGLYDPWGNPFTLIIDTQDIEELQFTFAGRPVHLKERRVAAFSSGPDKIMETADDVKTW